MLSLSYVLFSLVSILHPPPVDALTLGDVSSSPSDVFDHASRIRGLEH